MSVEYMSRRKGGEVDSVPPDEVDYMDVSPKQLADPAFVRKVRAALAPPAPEDEAAASEIDEVVAAVLRRGRRVVAAWGPNRMVQRHPERVAGVLAMVPARAELVALHKGTLDDLRLAVRRLEGMAESADELGDVVAAARRVVESADALRLAE